MSWMTASKTWVLWKQQDSLSTIMKNENTVEGKLYWSVISLIRLNSRMHRVPTLVLVGSRNARTSGLSLQNLVCATDSLVWPAATSFSSDCVKGHLVSCSLPVFQMESSVIFNHWSSSSNSSLSSFQIVSKFFSPEIHMNLYSEEVNLASSPWRSLQHLWWVSDRVSHVCWM